MEPEHDAELRDVVDAVRDWSGEPVAAPPTDIEALLFAVENGAGETMPEKRSRWIVAGWVMASAAVFLLALSQVNVRIEWGQARITLGNDVENKNNSNEMVITADLERRFNLERAHNWQSIEALEARTSQLEGSLEQTALELANRQYAESMTRFNDIQTLLAMSQSSK